MPTDNDLYGIHKQVLSKKDFSILSQLAQMKNQADSSVIQDSAKIKATILSQDFNEADREWASQYADSITNKIKDAAKYGDLSYALSTATELGATAPYNKEMLARLEANQEYKKWVNSVEDKESKGDITPIRKERLLQENPYEFKGNYDDKGNYLSRDTFTYPSIFNTIDLSSIAKEAANRVHEQIENNFVYDPNTNLSFTEQLASKTQKAIKEDFENIVANHPEIYKAIQEEMDDMYYQIKKWKKEQEQYSQDSDEYKKLDDYINNMRNELADGTVEGVFAKRAGSTIKNASYNIQKTNLRHLGGGGSKNNSGTEIPNYYSQIRGASVMLHVNQAQETMTGYLGAGANLKNNLEGTGHLLLQASRNASTEASK